MNKINDAIELLSRNRITHKAFGDNSLELIWRDKNGFVSFGERKVVVTTDEQGDLVYSDNCNKRAFSTAKDLVGFYIDSLVDGFSAAR